MTSSDPIENYEKTISELKTEIYYLKKYNHLDFDRFNDCDYSNHNEYCSNDYVDLVIMEHHMDSDEIENFMKFVVPQEILDKIDEFNNDSDNYSTDSDDDEELDIDNNEYCRYGNTEDGEWIVAGGGLSNGNAMATVRENCGKYYYCEYGACANEFGRVVDYYIGNTIEWGIKNWHNYFRNTETKNK